MKKQILRKIFAIAAIAGIMVTATEVSAKGKKRGSLEFGLNYSCLNNRFGEEFLVQEKFKYGAFKAGVATTSYFTDYVGFEKLDVQTFDFFLEGDVYPFSKNFFLGFRFSVFNYNRFSNEARKLLASSYPDFQKDFVGITYSGVLGIDIPLGYSVNLRLSCLPGIHIYNIAPWDMELLFDGSIPVITYSEDASEVHTRSFVLFNVGLVFKL